MSETRINVSQTTITAEDIGASSAVDIMPIASASNLGKIIQYMGTTDANYTNGYFYKCVSIESPESFVKIEDVSYEPSDPCYWEISVTDFEKFRSTYCMQDDQVVASRLYFGIGGGDSDVGYNYTTETDFVPKYSTDIDGLSLDDIHYSYGSTDYQGDGVIYQYTPAGATTYTWEQIEVQPAGDSLPDQTGKSGKFLTTNGTDASWGDAIVNNDSTNDKLIIGNGATASYPGSQSMVVVGANAIGRDHYAIAIGANADAHYLATAIGREAFSASGSIAIGQSARATGTHAIQISAYKSGYQAINPDDDTFKVANNNGNYEMMSADGTIPEDRLADTTNAQQGDVLTLNANGNAVWSNPSSGDAIQVTEMPEASYEELDKIYQYVGETNEYYTNGYFYKCIVIYDNYLSDESGDESGESGIIFSWERINVQPPLVIDKADEYKEYDAKYGWKFNTGFGELTLYTVNEIPEEGEILYQAETYAVPGITLKSATTGLVVPYIGWVKVAEYLPAGDGYPDRILITVGGITPLIPNTDSYTQPVLMRVS